MTRGITQYVSRLPIDPYVSVINKKNQNYSDQLISQSGFNTASLFAFGKLGNDTFKTSINGGTYDLVGSPIEYYYTDLVFLRNDYETALVGLYRNLAEMPNKRGEIKEAIGLVKEVAKRRGVNISENNAKARYRNEITNEIMTTWNNSYGTEKVRERDNLLNYYLNPTTANLNKIVSTAKGFAGNRTQFCLYLDTIENISLDFRGYLSTRL